MDGWQQGETLELTITDLSSSGDGLGRWQERVVFVPDTVPGDAIRVRLVQAKPTFARGKVRQLLSPSPDRVRPACIVADKCGGCQWQSVSYPAQLAAKQQQVVDALARLGKFTHPPVQPILGAELPLGYRNKATYPLARSPEGLVKAGYFRKGSHKLVNLNQCPVQDERLNPLLAEVKQDIQERGWSIYNESRHTGRLRHLGLRVGRRTGQLLLTLVSTAPNLKDIELQAQVWRERYPDLVGVCVNLNPEKTNAIFGPETLVIDGVPYVEEIFAHLRFRIHATTFFQVNTEQAERVLQVILEDLHLTGAETIIDAYCGVGTLTLPLAQRAKRCIGLEVQPEAVEQGLANAGLNGIDNVEFRAGDVGELLPKTAAALSAPPDIVVLDPPRRGCDRPVLDALVALKPPRLVYMSCDPATLARDLQILRDAGGYTLTHVQPADFFPQTPHVECVAFLVA
ncbi:MAG TPA: 23S rRNA (uracil(1939)-C(5))-methyltransferase RlmD [Leptolyngbyaceae cyanobacterium M65_K2018_010]|nr:23S rRNA (uracil(1939)-C(5))-methyltransferase RlmD [Leptolyngbyaceae cyanobacterium M65_K2018_010]